MLRHPQTSTLFPYTTLFRSQRVGDVTECAIDRSLVVDDQLALDRLREPHRRARAGDRKSTRLNSSHRTISYAVFCLKKKNNKVKNRTSPLAARRVAMGSPRP